MTNASPTTITEDAARFDAALSRLETALAASVQKVADMARRTGFEDGVAHASSEWASSQLDEVGATTPDLTPILREELEAARMREANLQEAVVSARAALDEAMEDIRSALGPL
jgi:formylmethanofuran:tetrahydromethanopterin formyltransferase